MKIADRKLVQEPLVESDDQLLERALAKDEKFRRLFSGDWSTYPSQSEADLALCSKLAFCPTERKKANSEEPGDIGG